MISLTLASGGALEYILDSQDSDELAGRRRHRCFGSRCRKVAPSRDRLTSLTSSVRSDDGDKGPDMFGRRFGYKVLREIRPVCHREDPPRNDEAVL